VEAVKFVLGHIDHCEHDCPQNSVLGQGRAQHSTAQHSTAQHSTAQHSTAQHSTAQHSTAQQQVFHISWGYYMHGSETKSHVHEM